MQPATGVVFREVEPTYDYHFHTAPQRQYIILLDGEIEIETSLGERRTFGAGDVLLMEDTAGRGTKLATCSRSGAGLFLLHCPDRGIVCRFSF